jgi:circadian clock protein KaiC
MYVLKSRGMAHSNQIREFVITPNGVDLIDVYTGPSGVLTGSLRIAQEARDRAEGEARDEASRRRERDLAHRRSVLAAQIEALNAELNAVDDERAENRSMENKERGADAAMRTAMHTRRSGGRAPQSVVNEASPEGGDGH